MSGHKVAVLDLGTNTFNLLLVKITPKAYYIFYDEKIPVKIGMNGISQGVISQEAQQRALTALHHYQKIINNEKISKVYGYATSAFRNAKNGKEFRAMIEEKTGLPINIISGEMEAECIYKGVSRALDIGSENAMIMDIGGGSVEFIIGNNKEILWKKSFEIGAQRLLDNFHQHDPIQSSDIKKLNRYLEEVLDPLNEVIEKYQPKTLIGSSGTFDTLSEIYCIASNIHITSDYTELPLTPKAVDDIFEKIVVRNREERLIIPGMIEMRADMIVVATSLVRFILGKYNLKKIRVSAYSLKEGMISHVQNVLIRQEKIALSK